MTRPRLLDLFCGAGGAGKGYADAGFDVVGVDINPQPRYPFEFHQGDALKYLLEHWREFDAFHASPPCQAFTNAQRIQGNDHPDFIGATREAFDLIWYRSRYGPGTKPAGYVIENVPGSPLRRPIELCGGMFGLGTYPSLTPGEQPGLLNNGVGEECRLALDRRRPHDRARRLQGSSRHRRRGRRAAVVPRGLPLAGLEDQAIPAGRQRLPAGTRPRDDLPSHRLRHALTPVSGVSHETRPSAC